MPLSRTSDLQDADSNFRVVYMSTRQLLSNALLRSTRRLWSTRTQSWGLTSSSDHIPSSDQVRNFTFRMLLLYLTDITVKLLLDVVLEADVRLQSHVVIDGKTRVGSGTEIHPFASLGGEPQDKKHQLFDKDEYEDWTLTIGSNCVIREHVTVHGSTSYSQAPTSVGDDCWLLCGAHVAHDSQVGRRVVVSNNVCLAGHVSIGDCAVIGGQVGIKQHVSVGPLAMVGGQSAVDGDVLPFGLVVGNRAKLAGLNLVGLRRAGVSRNNIKLLLRVYRYVFGALSCKRTGFAPALE